MKKIYTILIALFLLNGLVFAQDENADAKSKGKLQERMTEFMQKKLNLSKQEAEQFRPVFVRYILELRNTHREYKEDKLMLQSKVAELRLKFRDEFKTVMDEKRANRVFEVQRDFENRVKQELLDRRLNGAGGRALGGR